MKKFYPINAALKITALIITLLFCMELNAQSASGKITDKNGDPLPGASVQVKGTTTGAVAAADGNFALPKVPENSTLVVSYTGYISKEVAAGTGLSIVLDENTVLDEVIVTGVFDPRSRLEASVAISTLDAKAIQRQAPGSGADLLKNIPGVFVNSVYGEIRNVVYSRGISAASSEPSSGYYYVSLQEDGLPVTNLLYRNFVPDQFFRPDATLERVEAIRGGSASITSANAPGGIFNYISKTGGEKMEGQFTARFGLEGNGKNPYYRSDLNLGGPLSKDKSWRYNIGGFYRYSYGAHSPGYAQNHGGQLKANITKIYGKGSLKIYGKYMHDHNGQNEFIPSKNFDKPVPAEGFDNTSSVYIQDLEQPYTINGTENDVHKTSDLANNVNNYVGMTWKHDLGHGFSVRNDARYNVANANWNGTIVVSPMQLDFWLSHAILGTMGPGLFGTMIFKDHETGQTLGKVVQDFDPTVPNPGPPPFKFTVTESNFPGGNVQANSLLFMPLANSREHNTEFMDQFTLSKSFKKMHFTLGGYYAQSKLDFTQFGDAGLTLGTIENRPHRVDITVEGFDGNTYQVTNSNGVLKVGGVGRDKHKATQTNAAFFFGHDWKITNKLSLDWGGRYDVTGMVGDFYNAVSNHPGVNLPGNGGSDGNPLTIYDNFDGTLSTTPLHFDNSISTFSYSAGLNYAIDRQTAVYVRYTNGKKAPNATFYLDQDTQEKIDNLNPIAQQVVQLEGGLKIFKGGFSLFATPFYSILSNVNETVVGQEPDGTGYFLTDLYNTIKTAGLELETTVPIARNFSVRAVATLQKATATVYKTYDLGQNGSGDDRVIDLSGNEMENNPRVMFSLTPTYSTKKIDLGLNIYYMGARWANVANAFELPAYTTLNLVAGWQAAPRLRVGVNIQNLTNTYGIMGWTAPGAFPANLNRAGFTAEALAANPNAAFGTLGVQARSYFLSAAYSF